MSQIITSGQFVGSPDALDPHFGNGCFHQTSDQNMNKVLSLKFSCCDIDRARLFMGYQFFFQGVFFSHPNYFERLYFAALHSFKCGQKYKYHFMFLAAEKRVIVHQQPQHIFIDILLNTL
jgi:hypothetical protein